MTTEEVYRSEKENEKNELTVSEEESPKRLREKFFDFAGWLIIFFQSVPALFIWGGLMTLPFLFYLVVMFFSLGTVEVPLVTERGNLYFLEALDIFLFGGNRLPEVILSFTGLLILLYSVLFLRIRKPEGLVTSGPYHFVRHPQYLGVLIFITNLTSRSFRETLGDIGWIGPEWTFMIWFGTLLTYIALAVLEENYLSAKYGAPYNEYVRDSAFFIPFLKAKRRILDIILTLVVAVLLLFTTVYLAEFMPP
jgi:protein-S-isoprenylcysteine O-methyltransferase Ste14